MWYLCWDASSKVTNLLAALPGQESQSMGLSLLPEDETSVLSMPTDVTVVSESPSVVSVVQGMFQEAKEQGELPMLTVLLLYLKMSLPGLSIFPMFTELKKKELDRV